MAAVFFAVILSIVTGSLQDGVFDNLIKNLVSYYSGYIQVHKKGYWDERILENTFEGNPTLEKIMLARENVAGIAPRLESFALASSDVLTKGCMVVGVMPQKENEITNLESRLVEGEFIIEKDVDVLVSRGLADRLKVQLHDTIVVIGQGYHGATAAGKYHIKGILKFGSPDLNNQTLFLSLSQAQELFGADRMLTSYVLSIRKPSQLDATAVDMRSRIDGSLEVMTWEEMMPDVIQHIRTDKGSMMIITGVLYLLICFGILGTLLMMMVERKYEMGMLVAIGMKKARLMQLLLIESLLTVSIGCIMGILTSIPIVYYLKRYPIRFTGEYAKTYEEFGFEAIFPASTNPEIFVTQGLVVLSLSILLSLYPMVKVARLDPVKAMKK
jgi:ABC-type lipoprotein release transport system permease subunit